MTGFYVTLRGQPMFYAATQEAAVDWATNAAPRKPPKGFKWEVFRNDGVRVAVIKYSPLPQVVAP